MCWVEPKQRVGAVMIESPWANKRVSTAELEAESLGVCAQIMFVKECSSLFTQHKS